MTNSQFPWQTCFVVGRDICHLSFAIHACGTPASSILHLRGRDRKRLARRVKITHLATLLRCCQRSDAERRPGGSDGSEGKFSAQNISPQWCWPPESASHSLLWSDPAPAKSVPGRQRRLVLFPADGRLARLKPRHGLSV